MATQLTCKIHTIQFKQLLRANNLKVTTPRLLILDTLTHGLKPLSIKDISKLLPQVDTATIYRTIETYKQKDIISQIDFQHSHAHYELVNQKHHHHIICQSCRRVEDIKACNINIVEQAALKKHGFSEINTHALELFGTCNTCSI